MQHLLSNLSTPILHFSGIIAFIHLVYQILYLRTESRLYLRKKNQTTNTHEFGFSPIVAKENKVLQLLSILEMLVNRKIFTNSSRLYAKHFLQTYTYHK